MNKYTTLEQSKKLAEVWKDAETEKVWVTWEGLNQLFYRIKEEGGGNVLVGDLQGVIYSVAYDEVIPAFQISDILERLPAEVEEDEYFTYTLEISKYKEGDKIMYLAFYDDAECGALGDFQSRHESLLTALVDLTLWLHEQKYIGGQNG